MSKRYVIQVEVEVDRRVSSDDAARYVSNVLWGQTDSTDVVEVNFTDGWEVEA